MRFSAVLPVILCMGALVLSFLCLFAGSSKGFMESYALVTLNTSQIGQNVLNASHSSSNPFISFIDNVTNTIENEINDDLNSFAQDLGLHDFYSAHILDYCEGYYEPGSVPNATLSRSSIHRNVTSCSNKTAMYTFDPRTTLQQELNKTGHSNINLTELDWPSKVDEGLHALRIASKAVFVLYCIGIGFVGVATVFALLSIFFEGRLSSFVNVLIDLLAFVAIGLASAIVTAVIDKAAHTINKYGNDIGISADKGSKFLILTWVATAAMLVASMVWCFDCIVGSRKHRSPKTRAYADEAKH